MRLNSSSNHYRTCSCPWYLLDCAQAASSPDYFAFRFRDWNRSAIFCCWTSATGCYVATRGIFIGFCDGLAEAAIVVEARFGRQQLEPASNEILHEIATGGRGFADPLSAAADAEDLEHAGERLGSDGAFLIPRPIRLGVQPVKQGSGRDALRVTVVIEGFAQIIEELQAIFTIMNDVLFKDSGKGLVDASGPFTTDEVGDLE